MTETDPAVVGEAERFRACERSGERSLDLSRDLRRVLSLERDRERCRCEGMAVGLGHDAT